MLLVAIVSCFQTGVPVDVVNYPTDSIPSSAVIVGNETYGENIDIGYLTDNPDPPYRIAAISMAIEDGLANGLLPGHKFRYIVGDDVIDNFVQG